MKFEAVKRKNKKAENFKCKFHVRKRETTMEIEHTREGAAEAVMLAMLIRQNNTKTPEILAFFLILFSLLAMSEERRKE